MGFRSGLWEGHSKTSILSWFRHSSIILDVCLGLLCCWNTQLHPRHNRLPPDPLAAKQPHTIILPAPCLACRYGVLAVKSLTFSPLNILLLIVAKQLHFCFIWSQRFPPEGFSFVHVTINKLLFSFKMPLFEQGLLYCRAAHVDAKHIWLWRMSPVFQQLQLWWFWADSWPSLPLFSQHQEKVLFSSWLWQQLCHVAYTYNCLHSWLWDL